MMSVPVQVRRQEASQDADALFVPGDDAQAVLQLLVHLGLEPSPRLYRVAQGVLVKLDVPLRGAVPGALRLRALGPNLFLPADARVLPALLQDEAANLGAGVLLPGAPLRSFDPGAPLALSSLLGFGPVRRPVFEALPQPAPRASAIGELILDLPANDAEEMLKQAGQGIGQDQPTEAEAGRSLKGKAEFAAGKALANLGSAMGLDGLKKLGGKLIGKGLNDSPRQLENLLGRQEAALRDLLRKFQEGKLEDALSRALPISDDAGRGSTGAASASLPFHDTRYSLGNLLSGAMGAAANWFTEPDIYAALIAEYRKAAAQAGRDGDHRRAAFIHGKLLNDWRGAANVLQQAGLHHDAAVLYLQKLNDRPAAARAFEAAGEVDEAVRLYRGLGRHIEAGDLLRRASDEAAAVQEFHAAARNLSERGDFKAAGELMLSRASDPRAAIPYLQQGFAQRGHGQVAACGIHLLVIHADLEDPQGVHQTLQRGEQYFAAPGQDADAANFFSMVATLASRPSLARHGPELNDRARRGVAHKLRQRVHRGDGNAAELAQRCAAWTRATISDAGFAVQAEILRRQRQPGVRSTDAVVSTVRLCQGPVGPAAWAPACSTLFVTTVDGGLRGFSPEQGSFDLETRQGVPMALAVAEDGQSLAIVTQDATGDGRSLSSYAKGAKGNWRLCRRLPFGEQAGWLAMAAAPGGPLLAAPLADGYRIVGADSLAPRMEPGPPPPAITLQRPFLLRLQAKDRAPGWLLLAFSQRAAWTRWVEDNPAQWQSAPLHWQPALELAGSVSVLRAGADAAEVAGINEFGSLYWSRLDMSTVQPRVESRVVAAQGDFLCCCMAGPGRIAAVGRAHVAWFVKQGENFVRKAAIKISAQQAVSCHFADGSRELLVLMADGTIHLLSAPS